MASIHSAFADTTVGHFIKHQPQIGALPLQEKHRQPMVTKFLPHATNLVNTLKTAVSNGPSMNSSGGSVPSGGSIHTGGSLAPDDNPASMYHHLLNMNPREFEAYRETATQMLGGVPSKMWGPIENPNEPLEADADEYENLINMPNVHSAARMLEADDSSPTGGGFWRALKHVGRKFGSIYRVGSAGLNFVDRNKDLLLNLPGVSDYKEGISGFLDTAKALDDSINPLVNAAIDASKSAATDADRYKLKQLATQSIDKAVETHLPEAKKYIDVAKDLGNTIRESYNPTIQQ